MRVYLQVVTWWGSVEVPPPWVLTQWGTRCRSSCFLLYRTPQHYDIQTPAPRLYSPSIISYWSQAADNSSVSSTALVLKYFGEKSDELTSAWEVLPPLRLGPGADNCRLPGFTVFSSKQVSIQFPTRRKLFHYLRLANVSLSELKGSHCTMCKK